MGVRFDDIEGLRNQISDTFGPFGDKRRMSQDMVNRFADLTGDQQWIHVDVERAQAESPFGGPIVHGFFVLSMLAGLRPGSQVDVEGASMRINYGADKLRFLVRSLAVRRFTSARVLPTCRRRREARC